MNITDFKFYRKNNRYYFESDSLEGRITIYQGKIDNVIVMNGYANDSDVIGMFHLFNSNIAAVLGAEAV